MNIGQLDENKSDNNHVYARGGQEHKAPLWVRYYDTVVNLVTLGRTAKVHEQTLSLASLRPGDAILDIGCGTGMLLLAAEEKVGQGGLIVGLDVEPEMIRQAKRRARKNGSDAVFNIASIEKIPYPEYSFDVVFSTLMYHHLSDMAKVNGLVEVERVLKPNGRLVLVDINASRRSILTSLPGHHQVERGDFVRNEVAENLQAAGLSIMDVGAHPSRQLSYVIGKKN